MGALEADMAHCNDTLAQPRGRKRSRNDDDLDGLLDRFEASLKESPSNPHALLVTASKLQQLQVAVEKRLASSSVDGLTHHDVIEFIFRRKVRLLRIARNDFEESGSNDEDASLSAGSTSKLRSPRKKEAPRILVAIFQVGRERLAVLCQAEGAKGCDSRYSLQVRLTQASGQNVTVLLKCASWDEASSEVNCTAWEALRARFGLDKRPAIDFARGVVLHGVFTELRRRFSSEESDSEDECPGLVSTISICGMMAAGALPTLEGRLLAGHGKAVPEEPSKASEREDGKPATHAE